MQYKLNQPFYKKLSILQYYAALASTIVIRAIIYLLIHPCSYSQARCSHISDNITLYHCRNDTFNPYFFSHGHLHSY